MKRSEIGHSGRHQVLRLHGDGVQPPGQARAQHLSAQDEAADDPQAADQELTERPAAVEPFLHPQREEVAVGERRGLAEQAIELHLETPVSHESRAPAARRRARNRARSRVRAPGGFGVYPDHV